MSEENGNVSVISAFTGCLSLAYLVFLVVGIIWGYICGINIWVMLAVFFLALCVAVPIFKFIGCYREVEFFPGKIVINDDKAMLYSEFNQIKVGVDNKNKLRLFLLQNGTTAEEISMSGYDFDDVSRILSEFQKRGKQVVQDTDVREKTGFNFRTAAVRHSGVSYTETPQSSSSVTSKNNISSGRRRNVRNNAPKTSSSGNDGNNHSGRRLEL